MIRLRGHHLLCVLTFEGAGYNAQFARNLTAIVDRINDGEEILIVDGPDVICAPVIADTRIPIADWPGLRGVTRSLLKRCLR